MTEALTELEQLQAEFDRFRRRARRNASPRHGFTALRASG